jgi:nucleotide-binding universal stress UspA family protein
MTYRLPDALLRARAHPMKLESSRLCRVLCALDVDRSGHTALAMASLLGERFEASVDALYAPPPRLSVPANSAEQVQRLVHEHAAQERLATLVACTTRKVRVSPYVTPGLASAVILTHSERYTSDLIVLASSPHRRSAPSAGTIAPVSEHAPCGVLTVGDRFRPAPFRRILLPVGPGGVEPRACSWVTTLASRFDAEVGLVRIDQPQSGLWKVSTNLVESLTAGRVECQQVLDALGRAGIDAYEIAHPGGDDASALAELCEGGAFDAIVMGLTSAVGGGAEGDSVVAAVRRKTSAPVLSVRSAVRFAASRFEPLRQAAGAEWAQSC